MQNRRVLKLSNRRQVSESIFPINKFGKIGKIHSVFETTFNINVGDQLIHFSFNSNFLSSFGIKILNEDISYIKKYLQKNNIISIKENEIVIYSNVGILKLDFNLIDIVPLTVETIQINLEMTKKLQELISEFDFNQSGLPDDTRFKNSLQILKTPYLNDPDILTEILSIIVGNGIGLTPTGDDLLIGYMFIMRMYDSNVFDLFGKVISKEKLSTTDISREYLRQCAEGVFSSPLYKLFEYIKVRDTLQVKRQLYKISKLGGTSGLDTLAGINAGIDYIIERINQNG